MGILRQKSSKGNFKKQCTGPCGRILPATPKYFHRHKKEKDGLQHQCKECRSNAAKKTSHEYTPSDEKICTGCGTTSPGTDKFFSRNKGNADGLNSRCKKCVKDYQTDPEIRPRILARKKEYRNIPEIQERESARNKVYNSRPEIREINRKRDNERTKRPNRQLWKQSYSSRPEVREHKRDYMEVYHKANGKSYRSRPEVQEQARLHAHNRRARKKSVGGTYTPEQIREQLKRQRYHCYYAACGFAKFEKNEKRSFGYEFHIEHTFPLVRTETEPRNEISHIVLACPSCNQSKGKKLPHEWADGGRLL